jgi:hypothetical protein
VGSSRRRGRPAEDLSSGCSDAPRAAEGRLVVGICPASSPGFASHGWRRSASPAAPGSSGGEGARSVREIGEHRRPEVRWPLRVGRAGAAKEQRKGPTPAWTEGNLVPIRKYEACKWALVRVRCRKWQRCGK